MQEPLEPQSPRREPRRQRPPNPRREQRERTQERLRLNQQAPPRSPRRWPLFAALIMLLLMIGLIAAIMVSRANRTLLTIGPTDMPPITPNAAALALVNQTRAFATAAQETASAVVISPTRPANLSYLTHTAVVEEDMTRQSEQRLTPNATILALMAQTQRVQTTGSAVPPRDRTSTAIFERAAMVETLNAASRTPSAATNTTPTLIVVSGQSAALFTTETFTPAFELAVLTTPTATLSNSGECAFMWATHEQPELTARLQAAFTDAGITDATITAAEFGEDCMDSSGQIVGFGAISTDFVILLEADVARESGVLADALSVLANFPLDDLTSRLGYVDIRLPGEFPIRVRFEDIQNVVEENLSGVALLEALQELR